MNGHDEFVAAAALATGVITIQILGSVAVGCQPTAALKGDVGGVLALSISPDGRTIAIGGERGTVELWEVLTHRRRATLRGHVGYVRDVAFSDDGRMLSSAGLDGTIKVWDLATGRPRTLYRCSGNRMVSSVVFANNSKTLVSSDGYKRVMSWEISTKQSSAVLCGHAQAVGPIVAGRSGQVVASASVDGVIILWDVAAGKPTFVLRQSEPTHINTLAFSTGGKLLASGQLDGTIRLWDVPCGRLQSTLKGHRWPLTCVSFSPDEKLLASSAGDIEEEEEPGSSESEIILWEVATGRERAKLRSDAGAIMAVAFSPDGSLLVSGGEDGLLRLWSVPRLLAGK
jgi:WD40 repeat protein